MGDLSIALRVAARFQRQAAGWEGKLVGGNDTWRLRWSDHQWYLEELPQKGKRKLRVCDMQNVYGILRGAGKSDAFIPANILRAAGIGKGDHFEGVMSKVQKAMNAAGELTAASDPKLAWVGERPPAWHEHQVYFLEVEPEGVDPFTAEGQDFTVSVKWTEWSAYSPSSDLQSHDQSYTQYKSTAPQSARKMYLLLKENPDALKHVAWGKFGEWLKANKINYGTHFSTWH